MFSARRPMKIVWHHSLFSYIPKTCSIIRRPFDRRRIMHCTPFVCKCVRLSLRHSRVCNSSRMGDGRKFTFCVNISCSTRDQKRISFYYERAKVKISRSHKAWARDPGHEISVFYHPSSELKNGKSLKFKFNIQVTDDKYTLWCHFKEKKSNAEVTMMS